MTVDDDSSIYVGGLPYDATEKSLRRIFEIYGSVVAVKIINDRSVGGKCYGFVTFTSPRSAMHAIKETDGRTIDGRVVRVNEVKTRGGRSSFGREGLRRNSENAIDSDRNRDREKNHDHGRDRYHDNYRERSRDRDRDQERERKIDHIHDNGRTRDRIVDRDRVRDHNKELEDVAWERERIRDYDWERDRDSDKEILRTTHYHKSGERDKGQMAELIDRSNSNDRVKRNRSSESSDDDHGQVGKHLEISNQKLQELQTEISQLEELAEEKKQYVKKLREKSQKLGDSLTAAKRLTSFNQMQLSKLHKCYLQVQDYNERVKSSQLELQSLVDSTMMEMEYGDGVAQGLVS